MLPINLGLPALLVILLVCIVYRFIVWNFALIVLCRIYTCVEHTKKMSFFLNLQFLFLPSRLFRVLSNPLIISLQWLVRMICLYPPHRNAFFANFPIDRTWFYFLRLFISFCIILTFCTFFYSLLSRFIMISAPHGN